ERILVAGNRGTSTSPGSEPSNGSSGNGATSRLAALDPADGHILWDRQLPAWVWAPITVGGGVGFVAVNTDLQAFETTTGRKLFPFPTHGTITSAAAGVNGRVHFGSGLAYFVGEVDRKFFVLGLPGDAGGGGGGGGGGPSPETTFSAIYDDIFVAAGCNTASC